MPEAREQSWYDRHYATHREGLAPWYRHALPYLHRRVTPQTRLVELGCGQGQLLRHLAQAGVLPECQIFGLDQSRVAVQSVQEAMPAAHLAAGDIYRLPYPGASFDVCFLMETIEHLTEPLPALREIHRVLAPGGTLYVSFPNFLHLPWLAVRILAERFNRPNWIVLQPVDKIYIVPKVKKLIAEAGFVFQTGIGSNYGPPLLYKWERDWMTRGLNAAGLWWLSFHPILVFRKPE